MNQSERKQQALETLTILRDGRYRSFAGNEVSIADRLQDSIATTRVTTPEEWSAIIDQALSCPQQSVPAVIQVTAETTLAAARRLAQEEGYERVMILNFASAKNPGGGFLNGSEAQEESLARSSGLYACLQAERRYYGANRRQESKLYTDHAILSPRVPVFRGDDGVLLDRPYYVSFITMPAVNAGAIPANSPDRDRIEATMARRMDEICALSVKEDYGYLVLGAWGCGVFRNDPVTIARLFRECLFGPNRWAWRFKRVVFAVFDELPHRTLKAFQGAFAAQTSNEN